MKTRFFYLLAFIAFLSCQQNEKDSVSSNSSETDLKVAYEKITLDNGLTVLLHQDDSDPVAAVALTVHVGSAREKEGRTGFAHLFEHLLFLESENLGKGGLDAMSARIGGSGANGSTSRDRTNYYQTVPNDALEKMIWAEADKLGWFINTVTEPVLAKEKQVVKNEKRQSVDNRPYGHVRYVVGKNLYPKDHPYNWQVIGSLEDLQNATLSDVKEFYKRWYTPNNAILTIAGDFEMDQAKEWVRKYFNEIPAGQEVQPLPKQPITLENTKKLYYEDNFARVPQLQYTWPTVPQYQEDAYALNVLAQYLSSGKNAPLVKQLVEEDQFTSNVSMYQYGSELAGEFVVSVNAFPGIDLDSVAVSIDEALTDFEENGMPQEDLDRIKAGQESSYYRGLNSALGKGFQLAQYEMFAGDAGYINEEVEEIMAVTTDDVMRVYNKYIKGQNFIATSFVPKGQKELILENSSLAQVVEEKIIEGAEEEFDASIIATYEKTPSSFDRSKEPELGPAPSLNIPKVWEETLNNGISLFGITSNEVPLVEFSMDIEGGMLLDDKLGTANIMAQLMNRGTASKTPAELENAIESLGAVIRFNAGAKGVSVYGNTLQRNYDATMDLVSEMLLEPRWDEKQFDLIKQSVLSRIEQQKSNPNSIASLEFNKVLYGEGHPLAQNQLGTFETVNAITLQDVKNYYQSKLSPHLTDIVFVGAINADEASASLEDLAMKWDKKDVELPNYQVPEAPEKSAIYFYDVPNAKQSVLRFGRPAPAVTTDEYYLASLMNYRLGGGGFASQLTQQLREGKGYTYGIRSSFNGDDKMSIFNISSGVRSNVTYESTALIKEILDEYASNFNDEDLKVTKSYMLKSNVRRLETSGAKLGMLDDIASYGYDIDYMKEREKTINSLTVDQIKEIAKTHLKTDSMIYVIVGDAQTQMAKLTELGYGAPILLNPKMSELNK